jgi:hypothetical protein
MFVPMDAEFDEKTGDVIGGVLGWFEQAISKNLIAKNAIPYLNGVNIDGFELLTRLRSESESKKLRFLVVKNIELDVTTFSVDAYKTIDLVRKYGNQVRYWFDHVERTPVTDRLSVNGFEVEGIATINDKLEKVSLVIPCDKDYEKKRRRIMDAEKIHVTGMEIRVSLTNKSEQKLYILVHEWHPIETDLSLANNVLPVLNKWLELSPMVAADGAQLFSDSIVACLLANCFFSKESVPAFNLLVIGPKRNQKTAAIRFLVKDVMNGTCVSGSSSTGKGWLVSHKEGAEPSALFSTKTSLMIDEALKFSSIGGLDHRGLVLKIKDHFVTHMEIIQREEVESKSGNATIRGKMTCSLFAVDNPDSSVLEAMGRAYKVAEAPFRRWGYLYMDRLKGTISYLSTNQACGMMKKRFLKYGGVESIRSLMLLSRRKCNDWSDNADETWVRALKDGMKSEVDTCELFPDLDVISTIGDPDLKLLAQEEAKTHIEDDMEDLIQAAWSAAAAMRGWEVHTDWAKYDLVIDDEQKKIAEMIVRELFKGKLKLLFPGIISWLNDNMGVKRTGGFGYPQQQHQYKQRQSFSISKSEMEAAEKFRRGL